jgi:transcription initiation factor TFIIB
LRLPPSDIVSHLASIANNAQVSERTLRRAIEMVSTIKENHISSGKVPNALAVAVLYAACVDQGERVKQTAIASAGKTSMVTLRKRFIDVRKLFPHIPISLNDHP